MAALKRFQAISVRETFGVEFLKKAGIKSTEVIDPTLLIDDYGNLISGKIEPRREILFLALSDTKAQQDFIDASSNLLQMPVKKLYGYLQPSRRKNRQFATVAEWLKAIAESEIVMTDSFHAIVFSIMLRRPFYFFASAPSKTPRLKNLFKVLGIPMSRIVTSPAQVRAESDINFDEVHQRLRQLRADSLDFLKTTLKSLSTPK